MLEFGMQKQRLLKKVTSPTNITKKHGTFFVCISMCQQSRAHCGPTIDYFSIARNSVTQQGLFCYLNWE